MKNTFIISLDGGGIRGVVTAVLLDRMEETHPGLIDRADWLAGTSIGGILALGLADGYHPSDMVTFFKTKSRIIFDDSWMDNIKDLGRLTGADYNTGPLKQILKELFGDKTLGDLSRRVLIPTFQLDHKDPDTGRHNWKPKFFHNAPGKDSDRDEPVVDVALRTSAAPTYFPSYQGYIDGGVVANNPSMCALAQVTSNKNRLEQLEHIHLLSIGTGHDPAYLKGKTLDWGAAQWSKPILRLIMEGTSGVADYQCKKMLGKNYHRINPVLPDQIALDDISRIDDLIRLADRADIKTAFRWIKFAETQNK